EPTTVQAQALQDVLTRRDRRTYQAFFRRLLTTGVKPGFPRFKPATRYTSFTEQRVGTGATLGTGCLVPSKIGRSAVRLSRPVVGTIKPVTISREADGWYASFSCAEVSTQPLPQTGRETGIDACLKVFLVTAEGAPVKKPRHYRRAEKRLANAQTRL